jgi:hypothetical protein
VNDTGRAARFPPPSRGGQALKGQRRGGGSSFLPQRFLPSPPREAGGIRRPFLPRQRWTSAGALPRYSSPLPGACDGKQAGSTPDRSGRKIRPQSPATFARPPAPRGATMPHFWGDPRVAVNSGRRRRGIPCDSNRMSFRVEGAGRGRQVRQKLGVATECGGSSPANAPIAGSRPLICRPQGESIMSGLPPCPPFGV